MRSAAAGCGLRRVFQRRDAGRTASPGQESSVPPCRENAAPRPPESWGKHPGFPSEAEAPGMDGLFRAGDECGAIVEQR
ncbi:unnamed protein product [Rangifer tarandus platyrhynchus]|uniref:Uncharacterized protein n=1 Tax=Rangifer tarandus platyrhynchus TaxID=3082113 RepID=A0AC60A1R1_RANTA